MASIKNKLPSTVSFFSHLAQALVVLHGFLPPIPQVPQTYVSLPTKLSPQILIHKIFPPRHNNEIHICGLVYLRKAQMKYD